jgi:Pentapeptide repeats (8 copies)
VVGPVGSDFPRDYCVRDTYFRGRSLPQRAAIQGSTNGGKDLAVNDLGSADFAESDLTDADLDGAGLHDADLSGANLSGAKLSCTYASGEDQFCTVPDDRFEYEFHEAGGSAGTTVIVGGAGGK